MCISTHPVPTNTGDAAFDMSTCDNNKTTTTQATVSMSDDGSSCCPGDDHQVTNVSQSLSFVKSALHIPKSKDDCALFTDELTNVEDKYYVDPEIIGSGHYGTVRKCMNRDTKEWLAIKTIEKSKVDNLKHLEREIELLGQVDHPNIIKLHDVHEDKDFLHIITELCEGGELFDRIIAKSNTEQGHFSEQEVAKMIHSILDAIAYCHDKNIAHRDIKPENFIFTNTSDDSPLKLIDFGLARHHDSDEPMSDLAGTPYYIAPEILKKSHTKSCDMWSIGVLTYILLCSYPPFYGDSDEAIFCSVSRGRPNYYGQYWVDEISQEAKEFVMSLLRKRPSRRLTARQAMEHPWLKQQLAAADNTQSVSKRSVPFSSEEMDMTESPRKKIKEEAILFGYEVTETDVESIRCIIQDTYAENEGYRCLEPRVVTPPIV